MSDEIAVSVKNLHKSFKLPHEQHSGLKQMLVNRLKGVKGYENQHVLKDVSFEIKKGEFFGIVGRNGSGKSTLLKLLAGIYTPDKGGIYVNGSLTPFIELGVGFNPELTGRENVFLNGALLGFSRREMESMYNSIVEFAELDKFMDQKLKNYSSGMQVRLAFSVAVRANSDILVLDEVLAVGDSAFQQKCFNYFEQLRIDKKTIILVTHDMGAVNRFCDRAILLENGLVKASGAPKEIANQYLLDNIVGEKNKPSDNINLGQEIKKLEVRPISSLNPKADTDLEFEIIYELNYDIEVDIGISLAYQGQSIVEQNTKPVLLGHRPNTQYSLKYSISLDSFNSKRIQIDVAMFKRLDFSLIGFRTNALNIQISDDNKSVGGLMNIQGKWTV